MGRPTILKQRNLNINDIIATFDQTQSLVETAQAFDLSPKTVRSYLAKVGLTVKPKRKRKKRHHYGCLARWLQANPDATLPLSVKEIAEITGCSANEIKTYIYRRRKELRDRLKEIDFTKQHGLLQDIRFHRRTLPKQAIKTFRLTLNPSSKTVSLQATTKTGGTHKLLLSVDDLLK